MFRFPQIDDLPAFELPKFDLPKFDGKLPEFELPKFDLPEFDLPKFEFPKFDGKLPDLDAEIERITSFVRDAAYVGVGAFVVVAEQAEARRREITDQVTAAVRKVIDQPS